MNDLRIIAKRLIKKSFPELRNSKIILRCNGSKYVIESGVMGKEFYIEFNQDFRNSGLVIKEGAIAHELMHISQSKKMNFIKSLVDDLLYNISKKYRKSNERKTDINVIKKGYGKQLLEFLKYYKGKSIVKHYGLNVEEIKRIIT